MAGINSLIHTIVSPTTSSTSSNMSTMSANDATAKATRFFEQHPQVQVVIAQWVDICGILRSRLTSKQRFLSLVSANGGFNSSPLDLLLPVTADFVPQLFDHFTAASRIIPDVSSLRLGPPGTMSNTAVVFTQSSFLGVDARANLGRAVDTAAREHDAHFLIGFELEFVFLEKDNSALQAAGPQLMGVGVASPSYRSTIGTVINEIVVALAERDILVEQVIKEYRPSQWEVALPPLPPVESVDVYVQSREIIRSIAVKHGLQASFYPTPYLGESGQSSGQHIHMSVTKGKAGNDAADAAWNPDELLGGLLSHIPALMALGLTHIDSYPRVGSAKYAAGGLLGWGENNRDMPVRRISPYHWEVRGHDATSNPYAMVAGMLAAVMDRKPLLIGAAHKFTPALSEQEKDSLGLSRELPSTLEAALAELEADRTWAEQTLGKEFVHWFLLLKRTEMDKLASMDVKERKNLLIQHF